MRRLFGVLLAGALVLMPALSFAQAAQAPQKTTYTGEVVLAAYVVAPDKVADYEKVIATLKDALQKSTRPEAKQQLAGWRIMRNAAPQPGGDILFVHVINPVPEADYSITNLVYEVVQDPAARTDFYNLYRGALKQALFVIQGPVVSDLAR